MLVPPSPYRLQPASLRDYLDRPRPALLGREHGLLCGVPSLDDIGTQSGLAACPLLGVTQPSNGGVQRVRF